MTLTILSLEDEADVRDALERDLEEFWDKIRLEVAEDVDDAWAVIDEIVEDGDELALVLSDHRLPGKSGVDFLVELMKDERFGATRTVLVTGQADQSDTIRALNQAGLDYYIGKPWNPEELRTVVRDQLTEYVLESGVNPLPYVTVLDGRRGRAVSPSSPSPGELGLGRSFAVVAKLHVPCLIDGSIRAACRECCQQRRGTR